MAHSSGQQPADSDHTAHIRVPSSVDVPVATPAVDPNARTVRLAAPEPFVPEDVRKDSLFSNYAIISRIGDGGMGVVYLARDRRLGRFVAIKRLNRQAQSVPSLRQRFLQEARAVAALNHIYIVHIYALGEDDDGPYIVMEYIAGPSIEAHARPADAGQPGQPLTLDQHILRDGQLAVNEAIELIVKVGRAVAYAHGCGVIHRDLKPSNVLLDKSGEPKIVDFGLARLMRSEENKLTVPGEKLLSLGYGAPEQELDASLCDERADVYGLGAMLYFAISGQNPRYYREQDIPLALREALGKALATDREQRWGTASAFLEALRAVQSKTRVEAPTVKTIWRCKWCDTVNPLTIRYCAECGWDGGEVCIECGAETFVGVQYCGTCGADGRAYESLHHLIERMRVAAEKRQYERVISIAGRAHGFEPSGPAGRRLLKEAQEQRELAERALARRDQLKEQIPVEMRAENFERADQFIREYRTLADAPHAFDSEARGLPGLMLQRDLQRAQRALRAREWETAERICTDLLRNVAPGNADCLAMRRRIVTCRWSRRALIAASGGVALLLVYLLSLAPLAAALDTPMPAEARRFFRPAYWCYTRSSLARPLQAYANLWLRADLSAAFAVSSGIAPPVAGTNTTAELPEMRQLQTAFVQQVADIEAEQRRQAAAWPTEYRRELEALLDRRRAAGDFEGWAIIQTENQQFETARQIGPAHAGDPAELVALKTKYQQMLTAQRFDRCRRLVMESKKYINDLSDLQRVHTREGHMSVAAALNAEIKRVRSSADLQEAEAELATSLATSATPIDPTKVFPVTDNVAELGRIREDYERQLATLEKEYEDKTGRWPDKYIEALKQSMEQFQREGDFTGWEKANSELARFEVDRVVLPTDVVAQPVRLADLQKRQLALLDDYRRTRARGVVGLVDKSRLRLENLQKTLTRAGAMDPAAVVNAEIRRLLTRPEHLVAQAEIEAEKASKAPPAPPAGG